MLLGFYLFHQFLYFSFNDILHFLPNLLIRSKFVSMTHLLKSITSFFVDPVKSFTENRDLILYMIKADLKARHFRKLLGPLWWLFEPIMMSLVYFFLTAILFKSSSGSHQLVFILISVIVWRWFSKSVDESPTMLTSFGSALSRTNIPLLPFLYVFTGVQLFYFLTGLVVIFAFLILFQIPLTMFLVYLPMIMLVQITFNIGVSSLLARAGAHLKDLANATWVFTSIWFYMSPGIYSESLIPAHWRFFYDLNPWATILPAYRSVFIDGTMPDLVKLSIWLGIFLIMAIIGLKVINRNRGRMYKVL